MNLLKIALLEIVRLKAEKLKENSQIRLTSETPYYLFNMAGRLYIGTMKEEESAELFFPNYEVMTMREGKKKKPVARVQMYDINKHHEYTHYFRTHE